MLPHYGCPLTDVTRILRQVLESGDPWAAEQLLPLFYEELTNLAAAKNGQRKTDQLKIDFQTIEWLGTVCKIHYSF